jgi:hypothetical protein
MHLLLIIFLLLPSTAPPEAGRGQLTLVVRDRAGQRLPGVQVALIHDADDGRVLVRAARTDAQGAIIFTDLPWGLYIVQFRGQLGQQPILPPERQNLGLLDDGTGASGGFGVRFAETERSELFVLGSVPGAPHAVPLFDLAPSVQAAPQPFDPVLAPASPALVPAPAPAPPAQLGSDGAIGVLLLFVGGIGTTVLVGLWRARQARKEAR